MPSEPDCWIDPVKFGYSDVDGHGFRLMPTFRQNAFQMPDVWLAMNAVNCALVPEPSERVTGVMCMLGNLRPPLSAAMRASFQLVMTPVKMLAKVSGRRRRL